jgi:hypothetical protein
MKNVATMRFLSPHFFLYVGQRCSKLYFLAISFQSSKHKNRKKIVIKKIKCYMRAGTRKSQKRVTYFFEWPLCNINIFGRRRQLFGVTLKKDLSVVFRGTLSMYFVSLYFLFTIDENSFPSLMDDYLFITF